MVRNRVDVRYQLSFHDPEGKLLYEFPDVLDLDYTRGHLRVGSMTLYLPAQYENILSPVLPPCHRPLDFARHSQFRIWRSVDGSAATLEPYTVWLTLKPGRMVSLRGERFVKIQTFDWLWVLASRVVAYHTEDIHHEVIQIPGDDAMKQWFEDSFLNVVHNPPGRELQSGGYVEMEPRTGQAALISQESSYESVFASMVETAERTYHRGDWLTFDFFSANDRGDFPWTFGTRLEQLREDRSPGSHGAPIILSPWQGDISEIELATNYAEEYTAVYGLGPGLGSSRMVSLVQDAPRQAGSPFGRIETIEQARDATTIDEVSDAAAARLEFANPLNEIVVTIEDTKRYKYGRDYFYGDRFVVDFDDERVPVRVTGVNVSLRDGKETKRLAFETVR